MIPKLIKAEEDEEAEKGLKKDEEEEAIGYLVR